MQAKRSTEAPMRGSSTSVLGDEGTSHISKMLAALGLAGLGYCSFKILRLREILPKDAVLNVGSSVGGSFWGLLEIY